MASSSIRINEDEDNDFSLEDTSDHEIKSQTNISDARKGKNKRKLSSKGREFLTSSDKGALGTRAPKFSQEKFRELMVHALSKHGMPFSFVEYEGIRNLCSYLKPEVKHISKNIVEADIKKLHVREISRVKNELQSCPSRICLISNAWSSILTDGYLSMTAHFVDRNWVIQKRILNFSYMPLPHNGVALAEKLYNMASEWNIEEKIFSLTLENASVNDVCAQTLKSRLRLDGALVCDGSLFQVGCCAHILNLIAEDGLKEIEASVDRIRECVKYVKGSQDRKVKFIECIIQTSLDCGKPLVQDVSTIWISTYKMLASAIYYRPAFHYLELSDSNFRSCRSCPSDEEWLRVEKICTLLQVFNDATNAFSVSKYPTSNLFFPQVFVIQLKLLEESRSSDDYMKKIAEQMFAQFNRYWSEFNIILAIAVVFDPRYKFQMLEWSYQKLYGPESVELSRVKNALTSLFNEYVNANGLQAASLDSRASNDTPECDITNSSSFATFFKEFDEFDGFESAGTQKTQLEMYLDEPRVKRTSDLQILDYWNCQQFRFPDLAKLARDVLCVPVSTVASETTSSFGGRILDQFRSSLSPQILEALVCTKDWFFAEKELTDFRLEDLIQDILAINISKDGAEDFEGSCLN